MSEKPAETDHSHTSGKKRVARQLDATGWGLFFIWLGVSLLMDLSWSVGLIGIGSIVLIGQAARRSFGLRCEPLWVMVGVLFFLGGFWKLSNIDIDLLPVVLILAGGALMLSLFRGGPRADWRDCCRGTSYRDAERWRCCSWSTDDRRF